MTLYSLRKHNPDLDITLYRYDSEPNKQWKDEVAQDFHSYDGKDYMDLVPDLNIKIEEWTCPELEGVTPSHKSNIFKWQMLGQEEYIYFDMDILFLRDIQPVVDLVTQTLVSIDKWLMIGVLGSTGNNVFFNTAYRNCFNIFDKNRYQSLGVENIYSLLYGGFAYNDDGSVNWGYITGRDIAADISNTFGVTVNNLPKDLFYRYDHNEIGRAYTSEELDVSGMVGLHWYGGHVMSQRYNSILTKEYTDDTFICKLLREMM